MVWYNTDPPSFKVDLYDKNIPTTWVGIKPVCAGLTNLGNSCYMNASVQALMHIPGFVDFIVGDKDHRSKCFSSLTCLVCGVYRTYLNMSLHPTFKPIGLLNLLPQINHNLRKGNQEDALEFIVSLLSKIEDDLIKRHGTQLDFCSKQTNPVAKIFGWWMEYTDTCASCGFERLSYNPHSVFTLPVCAESSVQVQLKKDLESSQTIDNVKCWQGCKARCTRIMRMHTYPNILRIVLNRFDNVGSKIIAPMLTEQNLTLGDAVYSFTSGIAHEGVSCKSGHYTCLAVRPNGKLVHINDSIVSEVCEGNGLTADSIKRGMYVAFYQLHHVKAKSVKRSHSTTPSRIISPARKRTPLGSPFKRSIEKKGKRLIFSPGKLKRKVGKFLNILTCPIAKKGMESNNDDTLAKLLTNDPERPDESTAGHLGGENVVNRKRRLFPPSTSSQSTFEHCVRNKSAVDDAVSESTLTAIVTPVKISMVGQSQDVLESLEETPISPHSLPKDGFHQGDHTYCSSQSSEQPVQNTYKSAISHTAVTPVFGVPSINEGGDSLEHPEVSVRGSFEDESVDLEPSPFVPVHLTANDVVGANLPKPIVEKNSVHDLKRWLEVRGIPVGGNKRELIEKVKNCIAMKKNNVLDPKVDGGKPYEQKKQMFLQSQDLSQLSNEDIFPNDGWGVFPCRDMPINYNFGSVYHYLIETMPGMHDMAMMASDVESSSEDEVEDDDIIQISDPFQTDEANEIRSSKKLRRGLQYVKSGYVRNVQDCIVGKIHVYKGQVRASMREQAYIVKVGLSQLSGRVIRCSCDSRCPQNRLGRCSHVGAVLLFLLLHINLNGPGCKYYVVTGTPQFLMCISLCLLQLAYNICGRREINCIAVSILINSFGKYFLTVWYM